MNKRKQVENEDDEDENLIRAVVTESNGEISCSIEESNRVRSLLGIKPLRIGENEKTFQSSFIIEQRCCFIHIYNSNPFISLFQNKG